MIIDIRVSSGASENIANSIETCIEGLDGIASYDLDTSGRGVQVTLELGTRLDDAEHEQGIASAVEACLETLDGVLGWSVS